MKRHFLSTTDDYHKHRLDSLAWEITLSVIRNEVLAFLVARRTTTQIIIDYGESDWAGEWRGVLWCTVSWRWGVDLQRIATGDIRRQGDAVVVRVPEPELLDFAMSPGSEGFMSKSTAVPKMLDLCRGGWQRRLLEQKVREQAIRFAAENGLMPGRQEIIRQLNESAGMIGSAAGVKVRFE